MNKLIEIRRNFVEEAKNSPLLMADLSNMERLIAEGYSGRSLIELLQNADDANASSFYVHNDDDHIIVANNGRYFTDDDLIALCRSGSSTKRKKGNTIGYRGIGFKSVVNYAEEVHLISGDLRLTFSRELTDKIVGESKGVPLIRIPHEFCGEEYQHEISALIQRGYNTIFIFTKRNDLIAEEIEQFDSSCLLFLRNVNKIVLCNHFSECSISVIRKKHPWSSFVWTVEVFNGSNGRTYDYIVANLGSCSFAFNSDGQKAVCAIRGDNLFHSFMPTKDTFCLSCKVNGDFSTDPSRTRIIFDEDTKAVVKAGATELACFLSDIISKKNDILSIVSSISNVVIDPLKKLRTPNANDFFLDSLSEEMKHCTGTNVVLRPKWLSEKGFIELKQYDSAKTYISDSTMSIDGLSTFLHSLGYKELSLLDVLYILRSSKVSTALLAEIVAEIIKETRFGMSNEIATLIDEGYVFVTEKGLTKTNQIDCPFSESFISAVYSQLGNQSDFEWLCKRLKILQYLSPEKKAQSAIKEGEEVFATSRLSAIPITDKQKGKEDDKRNRWNIVGNYGIKKWRGTEQIVISYWESQKDVLSVRDVSKLNVGYDVEVILHDGSMLCVEVKSLSTMGEPFKMTNNEYSLASTMASQYMLALVVSGEKETDICFIEDPINNVNLTRRIVQWEWICNEYSGNVERILYYE